MTGLVTAVRYLTIVPVPGSARAGREDLGRSAAWFPLVGLAIGAVAVLVDRVTAFLFPTLLSALLTVTVWKLLTGGLHLDGLADSLDGLVGRDPEHRLAIMRDSRIGAFGAIGLILFLLLEIAALAELRGALRWRVLLAAPALARSMPLLIGRLFPAARREGHGASFQASLSANSAAVGVVAGVAVALAALGVPGIAAVVAGIAAALGFARLLAGRLSGVTGDVLGASIEVSELAVLLAVAAWAHLRP